MAITATVQTAPMPPTTRQHTVKRCACAALLLSLAAPGLAQQGQSLAKEAKNPFADLINLQLYNDATLGVGPDKQTQGVVTIQPLIPITLNADWTLITRTVLPLIAQPGLAPGEGWNRGQGDTQLTTFISPARTGALVWGIGPVFQIPTAANDALGQGKWGAGPAAGVQWTGQQWTFGALINNTWSFAGDASRAAVNQMQLEPEINYNFQSNPNRYLSFSPTITANWQAGGNERWTVPISLGIGQLVKIGRQSVNFQATAFYNVTAPPGSGNWTLELLVQFLYPQ